MSIFRTMAGETPTGTSKWFQEGSYVCRVRRCQHFMSAQGKGNGVAIEVTILAVPLAYEAGRQSWIEPGKTLPASNSPGEVCSTVLWLDRQQPAMGNLKGFLLAASRLTEQQVIEAHAHRHGRDVADPRTAEAAWIAFAERCTGGTGETLAGTVVCARANLIKKKDGGPFTKVVWEIANTDQLAKWTNTDADPAPATAGA